jgi:hypothetical protein
MAKKQKRIKPRRPETIWEYEYVIVEKGQKDEIIWIREDDERSASYKALSRGATGRIRSKVINTGEDADWRVKVQDLLP